MQPARQHRVLSRRFGEPGTDGCVLGASSRLHRQRCGNLFIDDNGNTLEDDIDKPGTAGVTRGCNPPVKDRFCPGDFVTREQMAAFLRRAPEE